MIEFLRELGQRVRDKRIECGLTQEELSKAVGYTSRSSINKIELGLVDVPQSKISALAAVLHCSPTYLLNGDNVNNINNSIIGCQNSTNAIHVSQREIKPIENAILTICESLTEKQKRKVLTFASKLLEEN